MNRIRSTLLCTIVVVAAAIQAQVPALISYQGRLLDSAGDPVTDGTFIVEFRL